MSETPLPAIAFIPEPGSVSLLRSERPDTLQVNFVSNPLSGAFGIAMALLVSAPLWSLIFAALKLLF